jgi:uncharacterized membrane protein YidH (DUF202 family)
MITGLFRRFLPKPIANTASQLRDHQANERTYLSWTRMGLAFAAMALAFGRLNIIDQIFNPHLNIEKLAEPSLEGRQVAIKATGPNREQGGLGKYGTEFQPMNMHDLVASRFCQAISMWSFGYGILRYLSVRKTLLQGNFVPAIWGPVFMTCGTLGVFGSIIHMDWRQRTSPIRQKKNRD